MRILVSMVSSATRLDGVSRHAINLVHCLLRLREIQRVDLVAGKWQIPFIEEIMSDAGPRLDLIEADVQESSFARNVWYYDRLPRLAWRMGSDLAHAVYPVPLNSSKFPCPVIITLHDLYPYDAPHNFGFPKVFLNRIILRQCLASADAIACVSDSTFERLRIYRHSLTSKATRIYNCIAAAPSNSIGPVDALAGKSFLLSVAQHRRNKDIPLTLRVFRQLLEFEPELLLALVGEHGPETRKIQLLINDLGLAAKVFLLEGLSERQLQWCYLNSRLLLATPTVEGFGLPVAEAMRAGCPVVCSDIPALREIGEGYAILVPLGQEKAFVDAIRRTLLDSRPSPRVLQNLNVDRIAECYIHLYQGLLTRQKTGSQNLVELRDQKDGAV